MKDFRGPLPLTGADFTRIRANVMAQVRPRRASFAFRWAFAMLAAAFIGVVSYKSLQVTPVTSAPPPPLRHAERSEASLPPQLPAAVPARPRHTTRSPLPVPRSSPIEAPTFRMEIQTADPDIRIIWLPNQDDPKSEETSS